jgi:hypothetical protein
MGRAGTIKGRSFRHFPCQPKRFMVPHDGAGGVIDLQLISKA